MLGLATLFYTWRPLWTRLLSPASSTGDKRATLSAELDRASLHTAVFTGTVYWIAGLAAILFPDTSGLDPEYGGPGFPQAKVFIFFAGSAIAGWLLETRQ